MHSVTKILTGSGINKIIIVDDAFDPPNRADYTTELNDFYTDIDGNKEIATELTSLGITISKELDITNDVLRVLWDNKDRLKELSEPCYEHLFPVIVSKESSVKDLVNLFQNTLKIDVKAFGSSYSPQTEECDLIFIDHYLGPLQESAEAVRRAKNLVKSIHADMPVKPLIVLMSSEKISDELINQFVEETGLIRGMFYFANKEELSDETRLCLKLTAFSMSLPNGYKIQHLLDAVEKSIADISSKFISDLKKLSLEDYAYIQKLSLQDDGQPLGDYLLWLYSSYYGHLLFEKNEEVQKRQAEINQLSMSNLPYYQGKPSMTLSDMYHSALFVGNIGELTAHPKTDKSKEDEQCYLNLGDLFANDKDEVLLVINAQCDLAYAPDGSSRQFKPNRSIVLIPGQLLEIAKGEIVFDPDDNTVKTFLFKHNDKAYLIKWNTKEVITHKYGQIRSWLKKNSYSRTTRLRLPFALEIQNAFASDLTRVGNPVAPPIVKPIKLIGYYKNKKQKAKKFIESNEGDVYLVASRTGYKCIITETFIHKFRDEINTVVAELKALGDDEKIKAIIKDIEPLATDYSKLMEMWNPIDLPKSGKSKDICGSKISITNTSTIDNGVPVNKAITLSLVL